MIHYIYKICFLCEEPGSYYIGKRSYRGTDITKDKYCGSGKYCDFYFKKHGIKLGETYVKEIIEINLSKEINSDRENYWIGDLWNTDPLCKNLMPGGDWKEDVVPTKAVIQYDLNGKEIARYNSQSAAACAVGAKSSAGISKCCIRKSLDREVKGYLWRFEDEPLQECDKINILTRRVPVQQFSKTGELLNTFSNAKEAGVALNIDSSAIIKCCKKRPKRNSAGGFIWRYIGEVPNNIDTTCFTEIICIHKYDSNGVHLDKFDSMHEAARSVNGKWQSIQKSCNNKTFAYGFLWLKDGDDISQLDLSRIKRSGSRTIYQYDSDGNLINVFKTLKEAGDSVGVAWQSIQRCCEGKTNQIKGFIWKRDSWS